MSVPYARLPGWVEYGLIPLINLLVAFIVAAITDVPAGTEMLSPSMVSVTVLSETRAGVPKSIS